MSAALGVRPCWVGGARAARRFGGASAALGRSCHGWRRRASNAAATTSIASVAHTAPSPQLRHRLRPWLVLGPRRSCEEHEREELSKKLRSARDQLLRSAEMLLPPLLCSKWLAHCGDKAPKSKAKAKARRDKIVFAVCPNCFFPGHKAAQCPYAPERVSNRSQKGGAAAAAVVEDEASWGWGVGDGGLEWGWAG